MSIEVYSSNTDWVPFWKKKKKRERENGIACLAHWASARTDIPEFRELFDQLWNFTKPNAWSGDTHSNIEVEGVDNWPWNPLVISQTKAT